ncbi:hypothetical protein M3J09_011321 [Ascochyta lentis]
MPSSLHATTRVATNQPTDHSPTIAARTHTNRLDHHLQPHTDQSPRLPFYLPTSNPGHPIPSHPIPRPNPTHRKRRTSPLHPCNTPLQQCDLLRGTRSEISSPLPVRVMGTGECVDGRGRSCCADADAGTGAGREGRTEGRGVLVEGYRSVRGLGRVDFVEAL